MGGRISRTELISGVWDADLNAHPEQESKFVDPATGYMCMVWRNEGNWTYCGYVFVPSTHPDFNKSASNLQSKLDAHGGITWSENGQIGFDTHHMLQGDISPVDETNIAQKPEIFHPVEPMPGYTKHYWTFEEVKEEVLELAKQLKNRENITNDQENDDGDAFLHEHGVETVGEVMATMARMMENVVSKISE
jgi:hypothetical protein